MKLLIHSGDQMPTPQATQNFMKTLHERFENRATRIIAAGTLVTMGALMLDACSSDPAPKPTHSHSAEASPTPEATNTANETMPASLEAAKDATFPDVLKMPLQDRLTYCSWETRDMPAVATNWEMNSHDKNDILTTITSKSTPQQLFTREMYNIRAAFISHENGEELPDLTTAQKILSCAYTNIDSEQATTMFNTLQQSYTDGQTGYAGGFYAQHGKFVTGTVTPEGTSVVDGNPTVNVSINYSDGAGTATATLTTIEGVDYNGQPTTYVTADFQ